MFQKIRYFFIFFLLFGFRAALGQDKILHTVIQWNDTLKKVKFDDNKVREVLNFKGAGFKIERFGSLPVFTESVYIPTNSTAKAEIKNPVYAIIKMLPADINQMTKYIGASITPAVSIAYVRKRPEACIFIIPVRQNAQTGAYEKLVSFDLSVTSLPLEGHKTRGGSLSYASNSVLATGNWYKIAVSRDGIYKIDKAFLQSIGINISSVNPANIRIYGNGGGTLPEINTDFHYDDLQENAVEVVGGAGGKFNDGDYVLFYGQGPVRWTLDTVNHRFVHLQNIYSNFTYYFLNIDLGSGKRIVNQPSSIQPANKTFNYFNDYALHELDTVNLIKSGRIWFGEEFQFIPSQSFSFNVPDILCDSLVTLVTAAASYSPDVSRYFYGTLNSQSFTMGPFVPSTSTFEGPFASYLVQPFNFNTCSSSININLNYSSIANQADGWLDYLELNAERKLNVSGGQLPFRVIRSVGANNVSQFTFPNASSQLSVWDVTDPLNVMNQSLVNSGGAASFTLNTPVLHEFVAFDGSSFLSPSFIGKMANQNLHAMSSKNYIIITTAALHNNAQDLANFHAQNSNLKTAVINVDQIYNEFGNGSPDATALRNFIKMLYDRATDSLSMPQYLVLFGDASYDYKDRVPDNTNLVPTYESVESLNSTSTFNTDDYFGCLDDGEGDMLAYSNKLDLAIGRLPVKTTSDATDLVNKIKTYVSSSSFGSWRNDITFCACDGDDNTHFNGAESLATWVSSNYPLYNIDKIYLDAYHRVSTPGGDRYPDVNTAINNKVAQGTLIFNYVGHGDPEGLAATRVLTNNDIIGWTNCFKLPLFVTATCDFSVFDNPQVTSAGEYMMLNPCGGAIAMVTTLRLVYSFANQILNQAFTEQIFKTINGSPIQIGLALQIGKNNAITQNADPVNNHKFCLLGDPAISLQSTNDQIITSSIDTQPVYSGSKPDTIKALQKVTITGYVGDATGKKLTNFNGTLYPTLFDKPITYETLGNDPTSKVAPFVLQNDAIFNGKASVKNGAFTFTFVVPKDISYKYGFGKISYYAFNTSISASGYNNQVVVGGFSNSTSANKTGPSINLFMNDENFVFGGTTDQNPTLIVDLKDPTGINTVGIGLGHDITGTLDNNSQNSFVLNDYYEANLDDYTSGKVSYPLKNLSAGRHSLTVKAWNVYDISNQGYTEFIVANSAAMALTHVLNYPNPFTTQTEFMFEHNMPGSLLDIQIDIYTVSGKRIKTIRTTAGSDPIASTGNQCTVETISGSYRVDGIKWDGLDDFGNPIGKGVYVYKVSVHSDNGLHADKFEKLVLLK